MKAENIPMAIINIGGIGARKSVLVVLSMTEAFVSSCGLAKTWKYVNNN